MTMRNNTCELWRRLIPAFLLLSLPFIAFAQPAPGNGSGAIRLSAADEIKSEFDSVPCKNGDRLKAVKALFEKMGAKPEEIMIEKGRGIENVIVRKPGANSSSEKIVIGAHYDKTSQGCGAIDNWTGVVAIAHLYRAVKDFPTNKTLIFVAFGEEEKGLVGSLGMTDKIKKEQVEEYCAMINVDSLGMGIPGTLDNVSSKKLIDFTVNLAKETNIPFARARIDGASSDSAPFISKKIPAVTIHSLNNQWRNILHTGFDQPAKVNQESVYFGYRLTAALLARVDEADCQAFREDKKKK
jgi:Iap family predicted aminopeptidase